MGPRSGDGSSGPNPVLFGPVPQESMKPELFLILVGPLASPHSGRGMAPMASPLSRAEKAKTPSGVLSCLISQVQGSFFSGLGTTQELNVAGDWPGEGATGGLFLTNDSRVKVSKRSHLAAASHFDRLRRRRQMPRASWSKPWRQQSEREGGRVSMESIVTEKSSVHGVFNNLIKKLFNLSMGISGGQINTIVVTY